MSTLDTAVEKFKASVQSEYELDAEVVQRLCEFFRENAQGNAPKAVKAKAKGKTKAAETAPVPAAPVVAPVPKTLRKKSAYNVYVREMMKTPDVSILNHRDKMSAIALLWKALDEPGKTKYADLAATCNDTESTVAL